MKKLLLLICLSLPCITALAQGDYTTNDYTVNVDRATITIKEGISLATVSRSVAGNAAASVSSGIAFTLNSSMFVNYKLKAGYSPFSIQTGFVYLGNGFTSRTNINTDGVDISSNTRTYTYYGQVPLNLMYRTHPGHNSLYFGIGPYIAACFRGKTLGTLTTTQNDKSVTTKVNQLLPVGSGPDDDLRRMDYGIDPLVGFQFETGWLITATYNKGFNNIYTNNSSVDYGFKSSGTNSALTLTIGISF